MPPPEPSRRFSFFGIGGGGRGGDTRKTDPVPAPPSLKLQTDKNVYRPGDPVVITIEIRNPSDAWSLLVDKLSFETKGIEKLDTQWFATQKPSPAESKHKRGSKFPSQLKFYSQCMCLCEYREINIDAQHKLAVLALI